MKYLLSLVFASITLLGFSQEEQPVVSKIVYENLRRTRAEYLNQYLDIEVGDTLSEEQVKKNAQYLKDLNMFFDVEYRIEPKEAGNVVVCFIISEARYVYPVVSNVSTDQKINFTAGVTDINFLGRGQTLGFLYQFYDRHSFKLFQMSPRHKNNITGHEIFLGKYSTIEPLYFNDGPVRFNFDNYHASSAIYFWLNRYIKTSVGGMYMYERYENQDRAIGFMNDTLNLGFKIQFHKVQFRNTWTYYNVNNHFERRDGISNHVHLEDIVTADQPESNFWKITNDFRWYKSLGKRGNLSAHQNLGIASNRMSPFAPFVVDGFLNVRGSGDRVARGTAEMIYNIEYAHTIIKHKWFFGQVATFTDIAYLRPPGEKISDMFKQENSYYYGGLGLRFQTRVIYNTVVRFDYGVNLNDFNQGGFIIGFNQFF